MTNKIINIAMDIVGIVAVLVFVTLLTVPVFLVVNEIYKNYQGEKSALPEEPQTAATTAASYTPPQTYLYDEDPYPDSHRTIALSTYLTGKYIQLEHSTGNWYKIEAFYTETPPDA